MARSPILTILIPARNDEFMGNFQYRLITTLETMAASAEAVGRLDDLEIIVCDWGSDIPLHEVLTLTPRAQSIVRYLIVPPDVARKTQGDSVFPIVLAQNAVIRRARGEYIMQTDSDVIFTPEFMQELFALLAGQRAHFVNANRALISARRRQIPWQVVSQSPPREVLVQVCQRAGEGFSVDSDAGFGYCTTGMMVMHRDVWFACTGYDERLVHWGWMEIDLGLRLTQKVPWFDVSSNLRMWVYHMEHYHPDNNRTDVGRKHNPQIRDNAFAPNPPNWGLADYDLRVWSYSVQPPESIFSLF